MTNPPDAGSVPVTTPAWVVGTVLACHNSLFGATGWARWTVTHQPTSIAVGWFTTLGRAKSYAGALLAALPALADYTDPADFTADDLAVVNRLYADYVEGEVEPGYTLDAAATIGLLGHPPEGGHHDQPATDSDTPA